MTPSPTEIRAEAVAAEIRRAEVVAAEIRRAEIAKAENRAKIRAEGNVADENIASEIRAEIHAVPSTTMKGTMASLPSTTVAPNSTVESLLSSVTPASLELPSVSATISSNWTAMLSTRHNDALLSFSSEVQQAIYEDTDRLANDGPINRKIIDFMEYLICLLYTSPSPRD